MKPSGEPVCRQPAADIRPDSKAHYDWLREIWDGMTRTQDVIARSVAIYAETLALLRVLDDAETEARNDPHP